MSFTKFSSTIYFQLLSMPETMIHNTKHITGFKAKEK